MIAIVVIIVIVSVVILTSHVAAADFEDEHDYHHFHHYHNFYSRYHNCHALSCTVRGSHLFGLWGCSSRYGNHIDVAVVPTLLRQAQVPLKSQHLFALRKHHQYIVAIDTHGNNDDVELNNISTTSYTDSSINFGYV